MAPLPTTQYHNSGKQAVDTMQQSEHDDISELLSLLEQAHRALARHWLGDDFAIELLLASVLAKGHVLIVDVPGVGKTTLETMRIGIATPWSHI